MNMTSGMQPMPPPTFVERDWVVFTVFGEGARVAYPIAQVHSIMEDANGTQLMAVDGSEWHPEETLDELIGMPKLVTEPETEE